MKTISLLTSLLICIGCSSSPHNTVLKEVISPNGKLKVVIFERNAGATTDFSTQASIFPTAYILKNDGGNIFIADRDHGKAPAASWGGPEVEAIWIDDLHLSIQHHASARVFKSEGLHDGVQIDYTTY